MFEQQSYKKRFQFSHQIRQRQKQEMFRKIRAQYNKGHNYNQVYNIQEEQIRINKQFRQVVDQLERMYGMSENINCIVENMKTIVEFIQNLRQFQDNIMIVTGKASMQYEKQQRKREAEKFAFGFQNKFAKSIGEKQKVQEQPPIMYVLQYYSHLISTIYNHISMDIESCSSPQTQQQQERQRRIEELNHQKQIPFSEIILTINYSLINMLAIQQVKQFPECVYVELFKFTFHVSFIDIFHNLFLNKIPPYIKIKFIDQFLTLLKQNPILTLNNCHTYTKILYYAISQSPKLVDYPYQEYKQYHSRVIEQIDSIYSILSFHQFKIFKKQQQHQMSQVQKQEILNQFKFYSIEILSQLCKYISNCRIIINTNTIVNEISNNIKQLRQLFTTTLTPVQSSKQLEQDEFDDENFSKIQYLINTLYFLVHLTNDDDILISIHQYYPLIWINLLSIFNKISVQHWANQYYSKNPSKIKSNNKNKNKENIKLPLLFEYSKFEYMVQKVLKCIINFICLPELCKNFIEYNYHINDSCEGNYKNYQWIEIITQIYNNHYRNQNIRLECLVLYSNVLLTLTRNQIYLRKKVGNQNYRNYQEQQQQGNENEENQLSNLTNILNSSSDLLLEVFKLRNSNKHIILGVMQTLCLMIEDFGNHIRNCQQFRNSSFTNRLMTIASFQEGIDNLGREGRKIQGYSQDVRMKAGRLLDMLKINNY